MHRLPLAAIAALSLAAAAPAAARSLPPSPAMLSSYASLGAVVFAAEANRAGNRAAACTAWRHLLWLEERDGSSASERATTLRLIAESCGALY